MKKNIIYGKNAVLEFLKTCQRPVEGRLLLARGQEKGIEKLMRDLSARLNIVCCPGPKRELDRLYPGILHQGFVFELRAGKNATPRLAGKPRQEFASDDHPETQAEENTLPPLPDEIAHWNWRTELPAAIERGEHPRVVLLDRVQDPGNLGAIIRSAAQFGIACIIIPKDGSSGLTPVARKAACGGECHVPLIVETNLVRVIRQLKEMGFWTAAAVAADGRDIREFDFASPFAIVLGSEGAGVRRLIAESCDWKLTIPMLPRLDSLNVSVSAGIIMHEMFAKKKTLK